jgi:hypothetical protein
LKKRKKQPVGEEKISSASDECAADQLEAASLSDVEECSSVKKFKTNNKKQQGECKFNKQCRFVLGKNVNEMYTKFQQQLNESNINSSRLNENVVACSAITTTTATTTATGTVETPSSGGSGMPNGLSECSFENQQTTKSIYSRYPQLFRYEADQHDRHWLNENSIIKRKNLKCYLLAYDEIEELFRTVFKDDDSATDDCRPGAGIEDSAASKKSVEENDDENENDSESECNRSTITRQEFNKCLSPFTLPDFILYKLNRQRHEFLRKTTSKQFI